MASCAERPPTPWPRMPSGQKSPFQNEPGPFIYALPNLAGTCPFSFSETGSACPFADGSAAPNQHHSHHNECHHHPAVTSCCQQHPPPEFAEWPPPPQPPPSIDESHFDLCDIRSPSVTAGRARFCTMQQNQHQHQQQESSASSEPSSPTRSSYTHSSPVRSEFMDANNLENEDEDENEEPEEEVKGKGKRRCRKRRRRNRGTRQTEPGCVMGPRMMGLSGVHFDRFTQYVCPAQPVLQPAAPAGMNRAWFVAAGYGGCAGSHSPARFWEPPMTVRVPGFVGMPCW